MKNIAFITPADAEFGFRLAGVRQHVVKEDALVDAVQEIILQEDTGLIVIDERLLTGMNEDIIRAIEKKWHGVFLALPAPVNAPAEIEDYAIRLMRRAIGYHVRLNL